MQLRVLASGVNSAKSKGVQYKMATGEVTTDYDGARISGRGNGGPLHRIIGGLVDVHNTLVSSKCAGLVRTIPDNSALSHKMKKMINKEDGKPRNKVIAQYKESSVYNLFTEMKVTGSEVEVLTNDVNWRKERG